MRTKVKYISKKIHKNETSVKLNNYTASAAFDANYRD